MQASNSQEGIPVNVTIPATALAKAKLGSPDWTLKVSATVEGKPFEALFALRVYSGSREADEADDAAAEARIDAAAESRKP